MMERSIRINRRQARCLILRIIQHAGSGLSRRPRCRLRCRNTAATNRGASAARLSEMTNNRASAQFSFFLACCINSWSRVDSDTIERRGHSVRQWRYLYCRRKALLGRGYRSQRRRNSLSSVIKQGVEGFIGAEHFGHRPYREDADAWVS